MHGVGGNVCIGVLHATDVSIYLQLCVCVNCDDNQVDAAKQETSEALVNLERERHKLSMLEVEVGILSLAGSGACCLSLPCVHIPSSWLKAYPVFHVLSTHSYLVAML